MRIVPLIFPTRRSLGFSLLTGAAIGGAIAAAGARTADQSPFGWVTVAVIVLGAIGGVMLPTATSLLATPGLVPLLLLFAAAIGHVATPSDDSLPPIAIACAALFVVERVRGRNLPTAVTALAAAAVLWAGVDCTAGAPGGSISVLFAFWPLITLATVHLVRRRAWHQPTWRWYVVPALAAAGAIVVTLRSDVNQPAIAPTLFDAAIAALVSLTLALWWMDRGDPRRGRRGAVRTSAAGTS